MRPKRLEIRSGCPVELTVSVIGGVWKPTILYHLLVKHRLRFMELARAIPDATQRMLALQLRELEADGIVVRHVFPEVPPRVEYELSTMGRTLGAVLRDLRVWGLSYRDQRALAQVESFADCPAARAGAPKPPPPDT